MNRSLVFILFVLPIFTQSYAQVLFSVGNEKVTLDEFRYIYEKNNAREENLYSRESLEEYLDLYIKFKLKVKAAKEAGLDTTEAFKKEFATYRDQLAKPYLTDKERTDALIGEAHRRMQRELNASHILITLPENPTPKDTLEALKKIREIRQKIVQQNANFEEMAEKYSEDPSAKHNKGNLGYFTVFHMIYPFESAAYKLKKGEISQPVRTQFGYHIIKLNDFRETRGEIRVAHIMVRADGDNPGMAKEKADSIYNKLQQGADFEQMVAKYSEDLNSKRSGGKLPAFNTFQTFLPEEFKEVAFSLEKDGDISRPFKTKFGWHIVKRISLEMPGTVEEERDYLVNRISRDSRSNISRKAAIVKIKEENDFKEKRKRLKPFYKNIDSTLLEGKWVMKDPDLYNDKWLFKMEDKEFTRHDFALYLLNNQENRNYPNVSYAIDHYYSDFVDQSVMSYQDSHLEEKYPEFKNLVQEYREGILLFEITDSKVWSRAMEDTAGLENFFEENKENYMFDKRIDMDIYSVKNEEIAGKVKTMIKSGIDAEKIRAAQNKKDPLNVTLDKGLFEVSGHEIAQKVKLEKGVQEIKWEGNLYVVNVKEIVPPSPKELSQIRGIVIADYQDYLEKQWVEELRKKYPVEVNEDAFEELTLKN